jgi:hypothetical protein
MAFRFAHDAEKYCDSKGEENAKAVRALWDAGAATYTTEIAEFAIAERFPDKPYVKIENDGLWPWLVYISAKIADRLRWRRIPESEYTAENWMEAAFAAWHDDDLIQVDRLFKEAALSSDATPSQIAKSLLLRAAVVEVLDRASEALSLLDETEERYSDSQDPQVRAYVAEAMYDRGGLHMRQRRRTEALSAFEAVVARFSDGKEPGVREQVTKAKSALAQLG